MSFKVIGIGEVLWDLLPSGPQLGGAPANFACHARQLGAESRVISRVGKDALGREIVRCFERMRLSGADLQLDETVSTGTVSVSLSGEGVPDYTIRGNVAWDCIVASPEALLAVQAADAVCFGTLAQRSTASRTAIQRLVGATSLHAWRVFDINLRQGFYDREIIERSLEKANVLKLNDQELGVLTPMFGLTGSANEKIEQLARQFELPLVALTRAERGSLLFQTGNWSELPGRQTEVVDTVGAGDAFTAGLVMGLLHRRALAEIHRIAADMASFVCSARGATPTLPRRLQTAFLPSCAKASAAVNISPQFNTTADR